MLFRVPPSALGDLSKLADSLKARGFPYNAVAVRFSFDLDASHPKPIFNAIRPLTDDEAEVVLELYHSDGTAAVLADNDIVVDTALAPQAPVAETLFEQPVVQVPGQQSQPHAQPAFVAPQGQPAPQPAQAPVAAEAPTTFRAPPPPPPVPGMTGAVVQPFNGGSVAPPPLSAFAAPALAPQPVPQAAPAGNPFAAAAQAPQAAPKPRKSNKPVDLPPQEPVAAAVETAPPQGQLDEDVNNILAGLSAFTGGK